MPKTILPAESQIYRCFVDLVGNADRVFIAGLPGVGKSLLLQQLTLMALEAGRQAHLLQWDTARQPFETPRYPLDQGATHPMVIKATGTWLREALLEWDNLYSTTNAILIGEVPLVGGRFMEIVRPTDDGAESLLADKGTQFVLPVPSRQVRAAYRDAAWRVNRQSDAQKRSAGRVARAVTRALAGSISHSCAIRDYRDALK